MQVGLTDNIQTEEEKKNHNERINATSIAVHPVEPDDTDEEDERGYLNYGKRGYEKW